MDDCFNERFFRLSDYEPTIDCSRCDILFDVDGETAYFVAFSVFPGIGPVRFKLLFDYFGSAKRAWEAPISELKEIGLGDIVSRKFDEFRELADIAGYMSTLTRLHVTPLTMYDPRYPPLLREIPDPPFVLYVLGKKKGPPIDLTRTIAVVGTRKITPYGREVTERLVTDLVRAGCTIISGMAYGVDAVAHRSALDAGGKTIAVLGCGIDIIAPASNARLYHEIADGGGAVVSEMPLGHRPTKGLFPARNRIISGLSLGTLVVEGAGDSGSLITARNAGEQGREVFAVPGPITSQLSKGPAILLKNGAVLVETAADILDALGLGTALKATSKRYKGETDEERRVLEILFTERCHVDTLVKRTNLTIAGVAATLTVLEIKGIVKDYGEKVYGIVG